MSEVGDAIDEVRAELAAAASEFLPGTCSLIGPTKTDDGFSGHTMADSVIATGIPCKVESPSGGYQINDGGALVVKTHRVTLSVTSVTMQITRHHKIAVDAQGLTPAITLEQPVTQLGHQDTFLRVVASVADGFRQPAMT